MRFQHAFKIVSRILISALMLSSLVACEDIKQLVGISSDSDMDDDAIVEVADLKIAVAPYVAWMPWFLAKEEGLYEQFREEYSVNVEFVSDNYVNTIERFVSGEVDALAITNIDAIAQLVRRDIEADVVIVTSYSNGNEALLIPEGANENIQGKTIALEEFSSRHYLLDRYLMRSNIAFDEVNINNTSDAQLTTTLNTKEVAGVVAGNPTSQQLVSQTNSKVLFDSKNIPNEIIDLIVVRREILLEHPNFAQALLATWFSVMERLQGNRKGTTLDEMARLAGLNREDFDKQLDGVKLNDTPVKTLSAIRNRSMRKTMRHIRYFIERHDLTGEEVFTGWVSYPGRSPALLHFNSEPLQKFLAPPEDIEF